MTTTRTLALLAALLAVPALAAPPVQPGARPGFLVESMREGPLKERLRACAAQRRAFRSSELAIGHRGAPLQFPEHTRESYEAAARLGAGIVECDVTFTKDKALVCRHAQNDLHRTTDILATPLAATCRMPFTPARFDADGALVRPATAECRTSDLTLAEFRTLRGRMDGFDARARTVEELLAGSGSGTLMTHAESIELFKALGVKMTPELKAPVVTMPFDGFTRQDFARRLIDEYVAAGVPATQVFPQSFDRADLREWRRHAPAFGARAIYLDGATTRAALPDAAALAALKAEGVSTWAPPLFALLALDDSGRLVPSAAARDAKAAGLEIVTWTLERSGRLADGRPGFYFQGLEPAIRREGDVFEVLDVLARQVGVRGVFSDWPATVAFYANCMAPN